MKHIANRASIIVAAVRRRNRRMAPPDPRPSIVTATCSAVILAVFTAGASATSIVLRSVDRMTQETDLVVRALPLSESATSKWDSNHQLIVTHTTFRVIEPLHGDARADDEIVVETFGGFVEADQIGLIIPGSPIFRPGEQVVLFLARTPDAQTFWTIDLAAGKFEVAAEEGKQIVTRRDLADVQVFDQRLKVPATLDELRGQVREAVARQAGRQDVKENEHEPADD